MGKFFLMLCCGLCSCQLMPQATVSQWREVTITSRVELVVPYNAFSSETEVNLEFSDGSCWRGYSSSSKPNERFLLKAQVGDTVSYRYNSHYLTKKQWRK